MRTPVVPIAASLVAGALALVTYKVWGLGQPFLPAPVNDAWVIGLEASGSSAGGVARIHLALPTAEFATLLVDERFAHPGFSRSIRARPRRRTLTLTAEDAAAGRLSASYRFSLVHGPGQSFPPADVRVLAEDTAASQQVPSDAEAVSTLARELLGSAGEPTAPLVARVRAQYDFVLDEVDADDSGPAADARTALNLRRGPPAARCALFVALVRSLGVPARLVWSLPLLEGASYRLDVSTEVHLDGAWVPVDPVRGLFAQPPRPSLPLARGDVEPVRFEGLENTQFRWSVGRLSPRERATINAARTPDPGWLEASSLDGLGPASRPVFRVLLLVPVGALVVSVFRNLVGLPTFGTFMPILVALALRDAPPLSGLAFLAILLLAGLATRGLLDRLRLLIVPRLSLLLTAVILVTTGIALGADRMGLGDALSVALLPMVVLTMTIERLSVTVIEEGLPNALKMLAGTVVVAAASLVILANDTLQEVMFAFPELQLVVMALLLLLGRYTGYRLSEWLRFRALVRDGANP